MSDRPPTPPCVPFGTRRFNQQSKEMYEGEVIAYPANYPQQEEYTDNYGIYYHNENTSPFKRYGYAYGKCCPVSVNAG